MSFFFCFFFETISGTPFQVLVPQSILLQLQKELPLVAFLQQAKLLFSAVGFLFRSGLEVDEMASRLQSLASTKFVEKS